MVLNSLNEIIHTHRKAVEFAEKYIERHQANPDIKYHTKLIDDVDFKAFNEILKIFNFKPITEQEWQKVER